MLSGLHPTQEADPNWMILCCCPLTAGTKQNWSFFVYFDGEIGRKCSSHVASRAARWSSQCSKRFAAVATLTGLEQRVGWGFGWVLLLGAWSSEACYSLSLLRRHQEEVKHWGRASSRFGFYSRWTGRTASGKGRCSAPRKDQDEPRRANIRGALCGAQYPRSAPPFDIHEVSCSRTRVREFMRSCRGPSQHIIYALTGA